MKVNLQNKYITTDISFRRHSKNLLISVTETERYRVVENPIIKEQKKKFAAKV